MSTNQALDSRSLSSTAAALLAAAACLAAIAIDVPQARAVELVVRYDQLQLPMLSRPLAGIIIGSPTIA